MDETDRNKIADELQKHAHPVNVESTDLYSPEESWKSMRRRHYELLWLIRNLGPFLTQNQADASLASLRNFLEAKSKMATGDYVLRNIFASKPIRNTMLVSTSMLSGSMKQMMI